MEMDFLIDDILKAIENGKNNEWLIRTDIQTAIEMYIGKLTQDNTEDYENGFNEGFDEGHTEGFEEGYNAGYKEGKFNTIEHIKEALIDIE